ncbi:MAG: hypothetical protein ACKPAJ_11820, partial [Actinomycetota bacterium]
CGFSSWHVCGLSTQKTDLMLPVAQCVEHAESNCDGATGLPRSTRQQTNHAADERSDDQFSSAHLPQG